VEVGAICSLLWGMFGLALLGAATQRCRRAVREREAAVAEAEAALRAEDALRLDAETALRQAAPG
jgi:hypothetical protein